ncbi:unnamed protein product [Darwinula stevensoni]|uniref:Uncharacterized protein n=1 Tax=Darwinula stevensoni TaxID=69355 RepID=A0A7R8X288_9CRUS|nr:unnamed protein product [Darwinula stevensoni]CAG0883630.1 unnamed protein product [Darwinula stevensoni]
MLLNEYGEPRLLVPRAMHFQLHQCSPECSKATESLLEHESLKGVNPLMIPEFFGFKRYILQYSSKDWNATTRAVVYRTPCGRMLRSELEVRRWLRFTKSPLGIDLFTFESSININHEFWGKQSRIINRDLSQGKEKVTIPVVNNIDFDHPQLQYNTHRFAKDGGVQLVTDEKFLVSCNCTDDCFDKAKCECAKLTKEECMRIFSRNTLQDTEIGYIFRRLKKHAAYAIYECNSKCMCRKTCLNRVAQHPMQTKLELFKTSRKGWGVRTLNDIPKGSFVCAYAGELLTSDMADMTGKKDGDEYFCDLDYMEVAAKTKDGYESDVQEPLSDSEEDGGSMWCGLDDAGSYVMDAKYMGNIARYMNHSCEPNIFVQSVFVDTHDPRTPWITFFAERNIRAGEELAWDYNYTVGSVPGRQLMCHCGAANCRQRLL